MLNAINEVASADVVSLLVRCPDCGEDLPRSAFYPQRTRPNGLYRHCKACYRRAEETETAKMAERFAALTFGVEIETIGVTRENAMRAVQRVVGGEVKYHGGSYDIWHCVAADGRVWQAVRDGSLTDCGRSAEIVSPILKAEDMDTLQGIVRALRSAGARVDESCGIHVHVGTQGLGVAPLTALVRSLAPNEAMLYEALNVVSSRRQYCGEMNVDFASTVEAARPRTLDALAKAWYGVSYVPHEHYHRSRYHGLNLHSVWYRGTIEFRYFNSTLHAGKVRAYVLLCLHLVNRSEFSKHVRRAKSRTGRDAMVAFLDWLGMSGAEYRNPRAHLLAQWDGEPREARSEGRAAA